MTIPTEAESRKTRARAWFEELRDRICAEFERIEDEHTGPLAHLPPGRFTREPWKRPEADAPDGDGGVISALRGGRVFEKIGVMTSTRIDGTLSPEFAKTIPGAEADPRFWSSSISLVAHVQNPHVPAVHMNTRHFMAAQSWWGGGSDLTPMVPNS